MRFICTTMLAFFVVVVPALTQPNAHASSASRYGKVAMPKKQVRLSKFDDDGYLSVPNSPLKCRQTLRGNLECR